MKVLRVILLALVFITLQAHAKDGRNLVVASGGSAGKRIALVIGNGNYQSDNLPKLANPPHDAEDIAKALRGFGFEVIEKKNLNKEDMDAAITEFGRKIADSEAALFYFAGHGLQMKGRNYLMPVNAKIDSEARVPYESVDVNLILDEMDNGKSRANIVMLDACRNNPISGKFRSGATRGLAAISSQPKGTVIVYATDPGNVAADGDGRNGLFTAGLLTAFKGGDLSLRGVLVRASKEVERGSDNKQTPYINGPATLQEEFRFGKGTQVASLEPVPTQPSARVKTKEQIEDEYWEEIKDSADLSGFEEYRKAYPEGRYLNTANLKIAQLKKKAPGSERPQPAQTGGSGPAMISIPGKNYEMGKYEVTQKEWRDIMGNNPSKFSSCGDTCPVEQVSWNDIQEFLQKLNAKTGKQYRLPTEAEWEHACYGGSQTEYCGGNDINAVAWYGGSYMNPPTGNSGDKTHPVGQKQANGYGLYDMSGNVWEWQSDCWNGDCAKRVVRGGSWIDTPQDVRAANRGYGGAAGRSRDIGFRLARTLP